MKNDKTTVPTLSVKVFSPSKIYYDGPAHTVSATNKTGVFDIMPLHHNFISLVTPGDVIVTTTKDETITIPIKQSLLHAAKDKITVFLDV